MAAHALSVVLDASVWVAAFIPDDVHHDATERWLSQSADLALVTPVFALAETAGAVARRTGSALLARRAATTIERLPTATRA